MTMLPEPAPAAPEFEASAEPVATPWWRESWVVVVATTAVALLFAVAAFYLLGALDPGPAGGCGGG